MIRRITVALLVIAALQSGRVIGQELDQDGKAHSWKGSSEQYKVIDFAAAWCRPCWAALPRLQRFADTRPSVSVIVVSVDERVEGRDKLVEALGLTVPVIWDQEHRVAEFYQPTGMPATFVLNPVGEIVFQHVGSGSDEWNEMVEFIDKALRE